MKLGLADNEAIKDRPRIKATRTHQGNGHWHVNVRSSVIVCGECNAKIPKNMRPGFCPECGAGRH
jgi:Zn finger protein HypA/HybF involved in hydrogenase expression